MTRLRKPFTFDYTIPAGPAGLFQEVLDVGAPPDGTLWLLEAAVVYLNLAAFSNTPPVYATFAVFVTINRDPNRSAQCVAAADGQRLSLVASMTAPAPITQADELTASIALANTTAGQVKGNGTAYFQLLQADVDGGGMGQLDTGADAEQFVRT